MFIIKPTLTEEETAARFEFIKETIEKNGGEIVKYADYGTRALAYEIKKQKRGHYFLVYYKAPPALNKELERVYGITEDIIRFMVVKYDSKKEVTYWTAMVEKL
jgi:small subunit ribosomal protein S6